MSRVLGAEDEQAMLTAIRAAGCPGWLIRQRELLHRVRGPEHGGDTGSLRTSLAPLRRKLEPGPARPRYLLTEPGMGDGFQP